MKILAFCDSPTLSTGFSHVARELFKVWLQLGAQIDVWSIGFDGRGYNRFPKLTLIPAGGSGQWYQVEALESFLRQLARGGYTHVFFLQDAFALAPNDFPTQLRFVCEKHKIRSLYYFPVDAPWDMEWADILSGFDVCVAYTQYGKSIAEAAARARAENIRKLVAQRLDRIKGDAVNPLVLTPHEEASLKNHMQTALILENMQVEVLPHGVDTALFFPMTNSDRMKVRFEMFGQTDPEIFWMINVNVHQKRKDVFRSMEILGALRARGVPAVMNMHMADLNAPDLVSLTSIARQLRLKHEWWGCNDHLFKSGGPANASVKDADMVRYYAMADLYLTTTLGEGWGLGITEALACGMPVAMPMHTSCEEIADGVSPAFAGSIARLPVEIGGVVLPQDMCRIRPRTDLNGAVDVIEHFYNSGKWREERQPLDDETRRWLSWPRIGQAMYFLLKGSGRVPGGNGIPELKVVENPGRN